MNRNALLALKKRVFIISLVSSHHWPFLLFDENEDQTRSRSFPSSEEVFDRVVLSVPLHLSGRSYSVPCAPSHHSGCVGSLDRHLQCQPRRTVTSPTEMSPENSFECFNQSKLSESSYSAKIVKPHFSFACSSSPIQLKVLEQRCVFYLGKSFYKTKLL